MPSAIYQGWTYAAAPIPEGLTRAVRFPTGSKPFESTAKLTNSIREFLSSYAALTPDVGSLLIAFVLATWFVDCLPVSPVLHLFGPEAETNVVLRLLGCMCRRALLLADVDLAALATLPSELSATMLINQRSLAPRVVRVLGASKDRHFCIAHGKTCLSTFGAKAFSDAPEAAGGIGVHLSLSPPQDPLPTLTDTAEKQSADDFQAKLLRYRMLNYRHVREVQLDLHDFVPAMRNEVHAWLTPICDDSDLRECVSSFLLRQSREEEGYRFSDDRCIVAETALFFSHKTDMEYFFVGELAECANNLLKGRHENRDLSDKMVGSLLRALGIRGQRVVQGYRIVLTDAVREHIHNIARAYQVPSVQSGLAQCRYCSGSKGT